ncbi:MAG TPA: hypothetical protein VGR20_06670 [Acidimicrobiia bacterium]|jgi:hypothetical protein|nr:hypothetical protein [Acidimicrobiia bacterium]
MDVDIRDSASLKPAELDELSQVLRKAGSPLPETTIDDQVERFSRVTMVVNEDEIHGFLFGSLERIGGTPCVLWGLAATDANGEAGPLLEAMTTELYRRAAISFPDEDVLVAGRIAHPALYQLFGKLQEPVPRPGYRASGEDRAWGRRLAKRFGCDANYDDRAFRSAGDGTPEPKLDIDLGVEPQPEVQELLAPVDPTKGDTLIAFGWAPAESLAAVLAKNGR